MQNCRRRNPIADLTAAATGDGTFRWQPCARRASVSRVAVTRLERPCSRRLKHDRGRVQFRVSISPAVHDPGLYLCMTTTPTTPSDTTRSTTSARPLLITVAQAAEALSLSRSSIYQLIWSEQLVPIRIGRSVRFSMQQIEQFVADSAANGQVTVLLRTRKQSVSMAATTITAREAAERLDVSTQRLRQLISAGDVRAEKHGHVWAVDPKSVDDYRRRRRPTAGRSLSSKMTWAALFSDFGTDVSDEIVHVFGLRRTEETRLACLSQRVPEAWRWLAQRRATAETFETRDAFLDRIASRDDVVRTGVSALADYDVDLISHAKHLDVYLPADAASELKQAMRLQPASTGNLILRSIADLEAGAFIMGREVMPRSVVAVDLLDDSDTRTARAGCDLIEAILDGR